MEDDAVHEPAEADAEEYSGCARPRDRLIGFAADGSRARSADSQWSRRCPYPWPVNRRCERHVFRLCESLFESSTAFPPGGGSIEEVMMSP